MNQIYATSEERKLRNRQAQAAFRERRTDYIKQLEAAIKQNEETLASLQQSQRSAADECLMLRYKSSLLERILLEKGQTNEFQPRISEPKILISGRHRCPSGVADEDRQSNTSLASSSSERTADQSTADTSLAIRRQKAESAPCRSRQLHHTRPGASERRDGISDTRLPISTDSVLARVVSDRLHPPLARGQAARWEVPTKLNCISSASTTAIPSLYSTIAACA